MRKLEAKEGYVYTQTYLKEGEGRVYSTLIYLASSDDICNWKEIKESEKEEISEEPEVVDAELEEAKNRKISNLTNFYNADNTFTLNGVVISIDHNTRSKLMDRLNAKEAMGQSNTKFWFNGKEYDLPISQCRQMLYAVESYAADCYDVYNNHINTISNLTSIDDVDNYDYRVGFPNKLAF